MCPLLYAPDSATSENSDSLRLSAAVVPVFQSFTIQLDPDSSQYTGSTCVEIEVREETSTFRFHAEDVKLSSVTLQGKTGQIPCILTAGRYGLTTVTTGSALEPGGYTLQLEFSNLFDTTAVSLYKVERSGKYYVFSQFQPS
ncbi:MAG: hypothetical protein OEM41_04395, partial [Ignavibacteria bacterium]|nr:hypothetical protein [Ignavibacteria bacterium]